MLYTDDVLFLHVPKTGGMSTTIYLLGNLKGNITLVEPKRRIEDALKHVPFDDVEARLTLVEGKRHEDLEQADRVLNGVGRSLSDFRVILATIRNPYDLEVSYFHHLQKKHVVARRSANSEAVQIALSGDFTQFAEAAPFAGHLPSRLERYFQVNGQVPANLHIVRFESMIETIPQIIKPYSFERANFLHRNQSADRTKWQSYLTQQSENAIYNKHRYLFDFYERINIKP